MVVLEVVVVCVLLTFGLPLCLVCSVHTLKVEVRHPHCVSNKSNYKVYAYIKHNYVVGGTIFTICKAQLYVSAINVGHLQVVPT